MINPRVDPHLVAWRYGKKLFGFEDLAPMPARGLLIGEAPGPNTDSRLPIFPDPPNSAAGRLRLYSGLSHAEWLSRLRRVNACEDLPWVDDKADLQRKMLERWLRCPDNFHGGEPLRVLLLGRKVQKIWDIRDMQDCGADGFGLTTREYVADRSVVQIAWIPHPSGLNQVYNDPEARQRAGRYIQWAAGMREQP